jgi:fermentation-respiration switch protein FrsA (DUF1100 family)
MTGSMLRIGLTVLSVYAAYVLLCFVFQRSLIFPGRHMSAPEGHGSSVPGLEKIWLATTTGKVEAWFIPPPPGVVTGRAPVSIFSHGNAEFIDIWPAYLSGMGEMGVSLMLVEYPGYGRSEGTPSEESIGEAMAAAYDWLARRPDVDAERIIVHGRSVGSGAACALLGKREIRAVILESGFTNIAAFAIRRLLPPFLVLDPFDNLEAVESYPGPVLVIHGRRDEIIPYWHGKKLAAAASNGRLVTYDCRHNDCPPDRGRFFRDIAAFLEENGVIGGGE